MTIAKKTKSQVDKRIIAELEAFKKDTSRHLLTNVTLSKHITSIVSKYMKPHEPVRTSFEYQLFLSIQRNTSTYPDFLKTN